MTVVDNGLFPIILIISPFPFGNQASLSMLIPALPFYLHDLLFEICCRDENS